MEKYLLERSIPPHLRVASALIAGIVYPAIEGIRGRWGQGFILVFHSINAGGFERLVEALEPNRPVALDEIVERSRQGRSTRGLLAITVDDGVGDTVRSIAEVAQRRQWPVTFYLPTAYLDSREPMPFQLWALIQRSLPKCVIHTPQMRVDLSSTSRRQEFRKRVHSSLRSEPLAHYAELVAGLARHLAEAEGLDFRMPAPISWAEVARMSADPLFSFESHGVSHSAVSALSDEELQIELRQSRDAITQYTGRECRHFCYPYGCPESIGTRAPVMAAGFYRSAVTMSRGRMAEGNLYLLPRIPLYQGDTPALARLKILTA